MIKRLAKILLLAIVGTGISLIILLTVFWAPDRSVAQLKQWQFPDSEFINIEGMQVHIRRSQKCAVDVNDQSLSSASVASIEQVDTIVLLHGTSASLHTWEGWTKELSDDYCVVSMDLPGFGLTGPFVDKRSAYNSTDYAAFITQVLDSLQLQQVTLVGNSLGGKIAWRTAALYPHYVKNLIVIDAVGYPAMPKSIPIGFRLAKYPILSPILNHVLPRAVVRKSLISVYADKTKVTDALVERYYDMALRQGNRRALIERLRDFDNFENQEEIKALTIPTLILWGAKDELIPVENAELFHRDITNSQLKIFANLGHVPHEEDPITTVAVAKKFLVNQSPVR